MAQGTVTFADLYGGYNQQTRSPVQTPQTTGKSTAAMTGLVDDGRRPAMVWVGMVVLLIMLRVLIEYE